MKNSIETIWKEGFLKEGSLVAPKVNDLYNRKSIHLVQRVRRMFGINTIILLIMAILFPIIHYFLGAFWPGAAASVLLLLTAWYNKWQLRGIRTLDQGATSLDYLKAFDAWLTDVISRSKKIARLSYPLYFLIAAGTIGSVWSQQEALVLQTRQRFPDMVFVGNIPLIALIVVGAITLLMACFSNRIYKWDLRLMYGEVFGKLKGTIAEMEELR